MVDLGLLGAGWVAGLCVGSLVGAIAARWAITRPDYKARWQASLKVIEALDAENTELSVGNTVRRSREIQRKADKALGRERSPADVLRELRRYGHKSHRPRSLDSYLRTAASGETREDT